MRRTHKIGPDPDKDGVDSRSFLDDAEPKYASRSGGMADAPDSKSGPCNGGVGSSPTFGNIGEPVGRARDKR